MEQRRKSTGIISYFIERSNHQFDLLELHLSTQRAPKHKITHTWSVGNTLLNTFSFFSCPSSVVAAHIFADVSTLTVCYQYNRITQVLKRPHNLHLLSYQLIVALSMNTSSALSVSTHTHTLTHTALYLAQRLDFSVSFRAGWEPEICGIWCSVAFRCKPYISTVPMCQEPPPFFSPCSVYVGSVLMRS